MKGAPQDRDVEAWGKFIRENGLGSSGKHGTPVGLREVKIQKEVELLDLKIKRQRAELIDRDEVANRFLHIATRQRAMLYQYLETELPPRMDGLPAAEGRPLLREVADKICEAMAEAMADFNRECDEAAALHPEPESVVAVSGVANDE